MQKLLIAACAVAVLSSSAQSQSPQVNEAEKLIDAQKYAEAKQMLLPSGKSDAGAAFLLGKIAMQQNDAPQAVDWLERAVAMNPRSSEYYDWLGKAYGSQAQRASKLKQPFLANKTKNAWERAIALDPRNIEAKEDMIQYYLQAPGFLGGSKDKAKVIAQDIRRLSAYRGAYAAVSVCTAMKDQSCVERELKSLAATYPDSGATHSALAAFYANAKQYDKAFAVIDQRLSVRPRDPSVLYALGRTASLSGQHLDRGEEALKVYITSPAPRGPSTANAHYRIGVIHEKRGAKDLARREYQTALQLNPRLEEAKKALAALAK